jgi:hypothetical protein
VTGGAESPVARWWGDLSRTQRVVVSVLGAVVAFNVGLVGLRSAIGGGNPGGPVSSSFSTGAGGLEAFADLADLSGHPVVRLTEPATPGDLPAGSTVVVADPGTMGEEEARAILQATAAGGRLVLAGSASAPLLQAALGDAVGVDVVDPEASLAVVDGGLGEGGFGEGRSVTGTARSIAGDGGTRWTTRRQVGVHVADASGRPVVVSAPLGQGEVVALADADPLQNEHLARADNAALALGLAGADGQTLVFVESVHGFSAGGVDAAPSAWRWAAAGLALAFVAGLWWAGARFGPAEPQSRALRPPRVDHVRAVAADLDRVSRTPADLVEPLARANRRHLAERLGVASDATEAVFQAAARDTGVDPALVASVVHDPTDHAAALAVGARAAQRQLTVLERVEPVAGPAPGSAPRSGPAPGTVHRP